LTDNIAFSSVHRFLGERSRAESSRDDNFRRLCSSLVGANGRSPEGGLGWNLCLLREIGTDHRSRSVPIFGDLCFFLRIGWWTIDGQRCLHSVQRVLVLKRTAVVWVRSRTGALRDDRRGVRRGRLYGMSVLLPSRHPDNAPGQDPCPSRKRDRP